MPEIRTLPYSLMECFTDVSRIRRTLASKGGAGVVLKMFIIVYFGGKQEICTLKIEFFL